jgi:hypothetical protein
MTTPAELAGRLDDIASALDELAYERLHAAAEAGATERPAADKALLQARRAVEKAAHLLRGVD